MRIVALFIGITVSVSLPGCVLWVNGGEPEPDDASTGSTSGGQECRDRDGDPCGCEDDEDCPEDFVCYTEQGQCYPKRKLARTP